MITCQKMQNVVLRHLKVNKIPCDILAHNRIRYLNASIITYDRFNVYIEYDFTFTPKGKEQKITLRKSSLVFKSCLISVEPHGDFDLNELDFSKQKTANTVQDMTFGHFSDTNTSSKIITSQGTLFLDCQFLAMDPYTILIKHRQNAFLQELTGNPTYSTPDAKSVSLIFKSAISGIEPQKIPNYHQMFQAIVTGSTEK